MHPSYEHSAEARRIVGTSTGTTVQTDVRSEEPHRKLRLTERFGLHHHARPSADRAERRTRSARWDGHTSLRPLCAAQRFVHERAPICRVQQQLVRDVIYTSTRGCGVGVRYGAGKYGAAGIASLPDPRAPTASAGGTSVGACLSGMKGTEAVVAGLRRNAGRYVHLPLRRLVLHEASTRFRAFLWRVPKRTGC